MEACSYYRRHSDFYPEFCGLTVISHCVLSESRVVVVFMDGGPGRQSRLSQSSAPKLCLIVDFCSYCRRQKDFQLVFYGSRVI